MACELHNRYLNGALGEIPADQCAPEIWIVDDRDEALGDSACWNAAAKRAGIGRAAVALRASAAKCSKRNSPCAGNVGRSGTALNR